MRYIDIPAIVLKVRVQSCDGVDYWPYDDGTSDPFWKGGAFPTFYRWKITMAVTEQRHSNHKTRKPNAFNGMDVSVGQYIADYANGITLLIREIVSKTDTEVTCIVEDSLRYNTFRFPGETGEGIFNVPSDAAIFEVNEDGLPVIDPLPDVGPAFFGNVMSHFQNMEKNTSFILEKPNHGFKVDQLVSADPEHNTFVLTDAEHPCIVGSVAYVNMGPDAFALNPIQKIIDNIDHLIGEVGDILYADPTVPGGVTLDAGGSPIMVKLRDWTPSHVTGTVIDGATAPGSTFVLNGVPIIVGGTGAPIDLLVAINGGSDQHGVVASLVSSPTVMEGILPTHFGEPALVAPQGGPYASATINGVLVEFSVSTTGRQLYGADYALEEDMAEAINAAKISNIVASTSANKLIITNLTGGPITIVNVAPDSDGTPVAGDNSGTGLGFAAPASSGSYVRLEAVDARAINLFDKLGSPTTDFGLYSAENGQKAAALYIEQGLRTASVQVVMNIAARNALNAVIGDQAHVLDKGDGEWGLYLFDGTAWNLVASHESAKVDADTYSLTVTPSSPATGVIGEVNDGTKVLVVTVGVTEAFDGSVSLTVGDDGDPARLMSADLNDLQVVGSYSATPTHVYSTGGDVDIKYRLNTSNCTVGSATITVSYS